MILAYAYEREDGGLVAVDLVIEKDGKFYEKETQKEVKQVVAKMSKSLKNVVNPNDIVNEYGGLYGYGTMESRSYYLSTSFS